MHLRARNFFVLIATLLALALVVPAASSASSSLVASLYMQRVAVDGPYVFYVSGEVANGILIRRVGIDGTDDHVIFRAESSGAVNLNNGLSDIHAGGGRVAVAVEHSNGD